jgi:hypothetical protein
VLKYEILKELIKDLIMFFEEFQSTACLYLEILSKTNELKC